MKLLLSAAGMLVLGLGSRSRMAPDSSTTGEQICRIWQDGEAAQAMARHLAGEFPADDWRAVELVPGRWAVGLCQDGEVLGWF